MGNLGNAYTAIGQMQEAIKYHMRRLEIANDANDLVRFGRDATHLHRERECVCVCVCVRVCVSCT